MDFLCVLLPILVIRKLHMSIKGKIGLFIIIALGLLWVLTV